MTARAVRSEHDLAALVTLLHTRRRPFRVTITSGKPRSTEQNRLQRLWCAEIAEQLGDRTPEEVRGEAKLTIGVPILRAENDDFRAKYDRTVRPLPYETKLALMMEPLDLPITRLMTAEQKTRYLDAMHRHYAAQGVQLTQPETVR